MSALCSLARCFTTEAKPDKTHTFAASGLDWSASLGVQAADLVFSISSHVAVLCAWGM